MSPKDSITATIEGNVIDILYVSELKMNTVLTYHGAICSVWPGTYLLFSIWPLLQKIRTPLLYMICIGHNVDACYITKCITAVFKCHLLAS